MLVPPRANTSTRPSGQPVECIPLTLQPSSPMWHMSKLRLCKLRMGASANRPALLMFVQDRSSTHSRDRQDSAAAPPVSDTWATKVKTTHHMFAGQHRRKLRRPTHAQLYT